MSIEVAELDDADLESWDDLLERAAGATPFHLSAGLRVLAERSGTTLHALVGYKGQQPVGLFPVFEGHRGPLTLAFSPPPDLKVVYLGPVLLDVDQLKRRTLDKRNRRFVDACLDWIDAELDPRYVNVRTGVGYGDPRPFAWNEMDVDTKYTYVVDLTPGTEALFESFAGDARSNVRAVRDADVDVTVSLGDAGDAERIAEHARERLADLGEHFLPSTEFALALYERLPDGVVRPYVCEVDGEYAGGTLALASHGTTYAWQGGAKPDGDLDLNDYVDWQIITDAVERGDEAFDLVGAGTPRLCWYKAKFAPDLRTYHVARQRSRSMAALASAYRWLR